MPYKCSLCKDSGTIELFDMKEIAPGKLTMIKNLSECSCKRRIVFIPSNEQIQISVLTEEVQNLKDINKSLRKALEVKDNAQIR